tara:strand:- start:291 stop:599 length:309 start_codon:yes stop_codon:yes gene_type:complete
MKIDDICLYRFINDNEADKWEEYLDSLNIVYKKLKYDPKTHDMNQLYDPISTWIKNEPKITTLPILTYLTIYDDPTDEVTYLARVATIHRTLDNIKKDKELK